MKLCWPYPARDPLQYRRIDQGWDLQVEVGTPILAVADGVIRYGHNLRGFGDPYPILMLDHPLDGKSAVYYGHNHPDLPEGTRVKQGDVIAHALQTPGGNASNLPGWLEIGFYPPGSMKAGLAMQAALIDAPLFKAVATPVSTPPPYPEDDTMPRHFLDPKRPADSKGRAPEWAVDRRGNIYCWNGARQLASLDSLTGGNHPDIEDAALDPSSDGLILFGADGHYEAPIDEWAQSTYKILAGEAPAKLS